MGVFFELYKKNFLVWRRNMAGCLCEVLTTVVFALLMVMIMSLSDDTVKPDSLFSAGAVRLGADNSLGGGGLTFPADEQAQVDYMKLVPGIGREIMKNCNYVLKSDDRDSKDRGGFVALSPTGSASVNKLKQLFEDVFDFRVKTYANKAAIQDFIKNESNYGKLDSNGKKIQVCLGITFEKEINHQWEYSIHYNVTGQPNNMDVQSLDENVVTKFQVEDNDKYTTHIKSGMSYLVNFIDNFILQTETGVSTANINAKLAKMPYKSYKKGSIFTNTSDGDISLYLVFAIMIIYLRFVYSILYEKEHRIAQNLSNMGMNMATYYLSSLAWYLTVLTGLSIVWVAIVSTTFFPDANLFLVWFLYWGTGLAFIGFGVFVTSFFSRAKPGILAAIVLFFLFYGVQIANGSIDTDSASQNFWFALSPISGLQKAGAIVVLVQSNYQTFDFSLFNEEILDFKYSMFLIIVLAEFFIFTLLGIYIDQIWPKETGVRKHPLFCFMKSKSRKSVHKESQIHDSPGLKSKGVNDPVYFEDVDKNLLAQKGRNQTLEVQGLKKVYPNGKAAVKGVTMTMYSNQIYALLGHNGAGKTTTISMISGLIPISEGSVSVLGYDTVRDQNKVREVMGICPQTNPIYPMMTCGEHLYLYAAVKSYNKSKEELDREVDTILKDIDLFDKKDFKAGKLSGGQKRKLCVACAFVGGSKVILLDEPTSGLDVSARRHLWEMLKKYKKDKIIILTTHYMDEADFLGDRIGVMGDGKLLTCGSSLFLKNKFGVGYGLTLVKSDSEVSTSKLTELIKSKVPSAYLEDDISKEVKYVLPTKDLDKFQTLFSTFEERSKEFGIESFGVSLTTLEDVFLRIAELLGHHDKKELSPQKQKAALAEAEEEEVELENIRIKNQSEIFSMHFNALLKKRIIYFKRDIKGLVCEIVIPIILVFAGILLTLIQIITESTPGLLTVASFELGAVNFNINSGIALTPFLDTTGITVKQETTANLLAFDQYLQDNHDQSRMFASYVSLDDTGADQYNYTIFANTTAGFSYPVALNLMNNAILKQAISDNTAHIKMTFEPFPLTESTRNFESSADGFMVTFLISLAFSFIPSSLVMFIVKERENNAKYQQIVSGVSLTAYWFSSLLVDYCKYLVVAVFTFLAILIFDIEGFLKDDQMSMTISLLLLFGPAMIGFTYLTGFMFKGESAAQIFTFIFSLFTGFILMFLSLIFRVIPSTRDIATNFLEWVFRFTPMYNVCFGLFTVTNLRSWEVLLDLEDTPGAWERYGALPELLFLIFMAVGSFTLIFIIEKSKGRVKQDKSTYDKIHGDEEVDEDVTNEEMEVKKNKDYTIKVQDVAKVFTMIDGGGGCCGKGKVIRKKAAVKGISFGVRKGECFGLLGTNGAGKTTTFKMLSGEIQPTTGFVKINGLSVATDMKKIRNLIGYCPQFDALLPKMTTREHLEMYAAIKGIPKNMWEKLISDKIQQLNLSKYEHVQAGTYSGGNKRKLSVAIALLGNPPIIFLDEPSSGMDPEARRFMWSVVGNISNKQKKSSVILTTHSMEEAEALSTKLAIMVEGKVKCIGPVQALKNKYGQGFELEAKVEAPTKTELAQLMKESGFTRDQRLNRAEIFEFLSKRGYAELENKISESGNGAFIHNDLKKKGTTESTVLMEYLFNHKRSQLLIDFLKQSFGNIEVIETYQSFWRFKVLDNVKLSQLFGEMEKNKKSLKLSQYSVKQTSIEQIFIKFANERVAD